MSENRSKFSRESLGGLYKELRSSLNNIVGPTKIEHELLPPSELLRSRSDRLITYILPLIGGFVCLRFILTVIAFLNYAPTPTAKASQNFGAIKFSDPAKQFIATELDKRRAELEKKKESIDERQREVSEKEQELAIKLSELRQLTQKLRDERTKKGVERDAQLEQLANVYVSMKPEEAARLLGQLDNMIALDLIKKMPEKRIGQLLSLMEPERALLMTKMLTGNSIKH
jgi:flagellar motility protein MotE (MotC chaperone)